MIIERLHFDADQIKAYDTLIDEHRFKSGTRTRP